MRSVKCERYAGCSVNYSTVDVCSRVAKLAGVGGACVCVYIKLERRLTVSI